MKKILALLIVLSFALPSQAFFWNKKNKQLENELRGKGYAGSLPSIEDTSPQKNRVKTAEPVFEPQSGFDDPSALKPVPETNPAFIDIIQKKDKQSQFVNDANNIIPMLEKLHDSIEDGESVQLFVAKGNLLTSNVDYLLSKYEGKPEYYYESLKKLAEVSRYTKTIMTLRKEALQYQRFLAYTESGSIYNPENIERQLEYLKEEINSAILLLREEG